jgi:Glycosyl hydrolases family 16/Calx-beta domain
LRIQTHSNALNMNKRIPFLALFLVSALCYNCNKEGTSEPTISLSIANLSVTEGNQDATIELTAVLNGTSSSEVKCHFETANGTALAGTDYTTTSGDLIFAAGTTTTKITIPVKGDLEEESNEYFTIRLTNPMQVILARDFASVEIKNDDLFIPTEGYTTPMQYPGKTLTWGDEFNGTNLDEAAWTQELGNNNGWGNNELQYYRAENTTLKDGFLVLEARAENFGGKAYTSSRMITKGKKEFKFGRIDIRAVLPETQGVWPALWMLGGDIDQKGWPACGEIDMMEMLGHEPNKVYGTAHYGPNVNQHQYKGDNLILPAGASFAKTFHVFSLEWTEDSMKWYIDDQLFYQFSKNDAGSFDYAFNHEFFFIFNIAVGGNWPGNPNGTTILPQQMIVDYVRVFQ